MLFNLNFYPLQVGENYSYLLHFRPNIYKFRCLNTNFIPNNWYKPIIKQNKNDYSCD